MMNYLSRRPSNIQQVNRSSRSGYQSLDVRNHQRTSGVRELTGKILARSKLEHDAASAQTPPDKATLEPTGATEAQPQPKRRKLRNDKAASDKGPSNLPTGELVQKPQAESTLKPQSESKLDAAPGETPSDSSTPEAQNDLPSGIDHEQYRRVQLLHESLQLEKFKEHEANLTDSGQIEDDLEIEDFVEDSIVPDKFVQQALLPAGPSFAIRGPGKRSTEENASYRRLLWDQNEIGDFPLVKIWCPWCMEKTRFSPHGRRDNYIVKKNHLIDLRPQWTKEPVLYISPYIVCDACKAQGYFSSHYFRPVSAEIPWVASDVLRQWGDRRQDMPESQLFVEFGKQVEKWFGKKFARDGEWTRETAEPAEEEGVEILEEYDD